MQPTLTKTERLLQTFSYCGLGGLGLEGVEVLAGLGLSGRQARVYLALLKAGDAKVRTVADLTLIDRHEVYRALESLQQLGLVQQNVTVPTTYTAAPIEDAIQLLLEEKSSELRFVSQKANRLIKKLSQKPRFAPVAVAAKPCFGVVVERDGGKRYLKATQQTQQSIEIITSWPRFKTICFLLETQLKAALKRGVTIQAVAEKPQNHSLPKWVTLAITKYPNFQLKTTPNLPSAGILTFDNAQAAIASNINSGLIRGQTLWSANPHLIAVCHAYFNQTWTQTN